MRRQGKANVKKSELSDQILNYAASSAEKVPAVNFMEGHLK